MTHRVIVPLVAALLTGAGIARSYTGGPQVVEVLGWDAGARRVYFHSIPQDESNSFGAVSYFEVKGDREEKPKQLPWSTGDADANDPDRNRRLQSLRRGLTTMTPRPGSSLGWGVDIVSADSIALPSSRGRIPRYRLRLKTHDGPRFECIAYHRPEMCVKDVYAIPGSQKWLYVVAFRGNRFDEAETQVPVLSAPSSDRTIPVMWERAR